MKHWRKALVRFCRAAVNIAGAVYIFHGALIDTGHSMKQLVVDRNLRWDW